MWALRLTFESTHTPKPCGAAVQCSGPTSPAYYLVLFLRRRRALSVNEFCSLQTTIHVRTRVQVVNRCSRLRGEPKGSVSTAEASLQLLLARLATRHGSRPGPLGKLEQGLLQFFVLDAGALYSALLCAEKVSVSCFRIHFSPTGAPAWPAGMRPATATGDVRKKRMNPP